MISLVTACMNRDGHLQRTLPAWLSLPDIAEVIVVDWSNRTSLRSLRALDSRVRVLRVEGEPRWVLSYAYNLGISHTRYETILKCDADCLPTDAVVRLRPAPDAFYAGYWKSGAACGKPSVNGQCMFSRAQFEKVNGYSEVIRMYGRDDEDFYDRLMAAGFARREIPVSALSFVDHSQEERLVNQTLQPASDLVDRFAQSVPCYFEMYNLALTQLLPWGVWQARARFNLLEEADDGFICTRDKTREIPVALPLQALARLHGLRALVAQYCGITAAQASNMNEASCRVVLLRRLTALRWGGGKAHSG